METALYRKCLSCANLGTEHYIWFKRPGNNSAITSPVPSSVATLLWRCFVLALFTDAASNTLCPIHRLFAKPVKLALCHTSLLNFAKVSQEGHDVLTFYSRHTETGAKVRVLTFHAVSVSDFVSTLRYKVNKQHKGTTNFFFKQF